MTLLKTLQFGDLKANVYDSNDSVGLAAAQDAREIIRRTLDERGEANLILATGNSQLTFLRHLRGFTDIDWSKIRIFHMDEYLGIDPAHPASFPLYLHKHLIDHINPMAFYPVPGQPNDAEQACREYESLLRQYPADMVALGLGENGHLAFNDPPYAKFDDPVWVKVIELAEASRKQQVGEGHFATIDDVPTHAITLTIPALLSAKTMLCIVPEARKAEAVRACMLDPISEDAPGSILRNAPHARLYLDQDSAAKLS